MKLTRLLYAVSILTLYLGGIPGWAGTPEVAGVPNFHQVAQNIYRGGQPTGQGWNSLAKLGVKVIIDLRRDGEHSVQGERKAVTAAGMRYVNVPMNGVVAPSGESVQKVLALLDGSSSSPVFVHCRRGADRTGTVIACYRIKYDHWQNDKALHEAKSYGMHWTEVGMKKYVRSYHPTVENLATAGDPTIAAAGQR
ncbi:MAG: tyrosine-protein phosphatase [Bryobacteraceae bacterium]